MSINGHRMTEQLTEEAIDKFYHPIVCAPRRSLRLFTYIEGYRCRIMKPQRTSQGHPTQVSLERRNTPRVRVHKISQAHMVMKRIIGTSPDLASTLPCNTLPITTTAGLRFHKIGQAHRFQPIIMKRPVLITSCLKPNIPLPFQTFLSTFTRHLFHKLTHCAHHRPILVVRLPSMAAIVTSGWTVLWRCTPTIPITGGLFHGTVYQPCRPANHRPIVMSRLLIIILTSCISLPTTATTILWRGMPTISMTGGQHTSSRAALRHANHRTIPRIRALVKTPTPGGSLPCSPVTSFSPAGEPGMNSDLSCSRLHIEPGNDIKQLICFKKTAIYCAICVLLVLEPWRHLSGVNP